MSDLDRRIRTVGMSLIVLFLVLFVNVNWISVWRAQALRTDPANSRYLIGEFSRPRGVILSADGKVLAQSVETNDEFKRTRTYAEGDATAHVVGYLALRQGAAGLEASQAARLTGESEQRRVANLVDYLFGQPEPGAIRITLDTNVQNAARAALGDQKGGVAAINPQTGAIYALWANPSFDPNAVADPARADEQQRAFAALSQGDKPGVSRAFQDVYPPGSTFKVVTAAAALASVGPSAAFDNPDVLELPDSTVGLRNFGGGQCRADAPGGKVTLGGGFVQSCNTTFAQIGIAIGPDRMRAQAEAFGFGAAPPIDIEAAPSEFPSDAELQGSRSSLAQSSIGQFGVRASPLQMAMVAGGVANNGIVMRPYLVQEVFDGKGRVASTTRPEVFRQAMDPSAAQVLKGLMVQVVAGGTGTAGQIDGVSVGGKTGTAQTVDGAAPHAWFVAFAPADNPVVAVAVVVENGGSLGNEATGGAVAAPIARAVMETVPGVRP